MTTPLIRAIEPTDVPGLERFYAELSPEDRRTRFLHVGARLSPSQAISFCTPDHAHEDGFVAIVREPGDEERIVGHLCLEPDGVDTAEVAIAVAGRCQRAGLGGRLLAAGVDRARRDGITRLTATMFAENAPIQRLLRGLGAPTTERCIGAGVTEVTIDIAADRIAS